MGLYSVIIYKVKAEEKKIKNKLERDKIIDLTNSVKITKSGVEPVNGMAFGIKITYSNGEQFLASFTSSKTGAVTIHSTGDKGSWCNIDRNTVDDLRNYYDKN